MTSMPASRSARAIIFAPRSCPSSPGFAISTRIVLSAIRLERISLSDGNFFVDAEDVAKGIADFAESGVGFDGFVDVRHQIFVAFGGFAQRFQAALDFRARTVRAEFAEALGLAMRDRFVDEQRVDGFFFG